MSNDRSVRLVTEEGKEVVEVEQEPATIMVLPDPQMVKRDAWIEAQPEEDRRLHRANLAAGAGVQDLAETVSAAIAEMASGERVRVTLHLCNGLSDTERAEVLVQAKYDLPPLKVAFAKATPKARGDFLDSLSPAQKMRVKRRSKARGGASHLERQLTALDGSLRQRANDIARGRVFSDQDQAHFRHEASSRLMRILRDLEHARPLDLLAPHDRKQLAWQNAPVVEQRLWRAMEAKANDPDIIAINEQAETDRPVRPALVKSQLGKFVK